MGLLERFGRIADTYVSEKEQLIGAEEERRGCILAMVSGLQKYSGTPSFSLL